MKKSLLLSIYFAFFVSSVFAATDDLSKLRTKEFIVMGYRGIQADVAEGDGPYLKTLMDLLRIDREQITPTQEKIESLMKDHPNIMDFADRVLELQSNSNKTPTQSAPAVVLPTGPHIYSGDKLENALNHLTRGMNVTVYSKTGERTSGEFEDYAVKRLRVKGHTRKSFHLREILAIDAPQL